MEFNRDLQRVSARILALCWADAQFKQRFRQDPAGVFMEQGYNPSEGEALAPDSEPIRSILEEADRYAPPLEPFAPPRFPAAASSPAQGPSQVPMCAYSPAPASPLPHQGVYAYTGYSVNPAYSGYPSYPVYAQPYYGDYRQPYPAPPQPFYPAAGAYGYPAMCGQSAPYGYTPAPPQGCYYAAPAHAPFTVPPMCAQPVSHPAAEHGSASRIPPMCG